MSPPPANPAAPGDKGPLVPPLPAKGLRGGGGGRPPADRRWLLWLAALAVGVGLGVGGYQLSPVANLFDYWLALALS